MSLSIEQVQRIAKLARIEMDATQIGSAQDKLNSILSLIDQLQSVDTTGIEPMSHPMELSTRLREDQVTEHNQREAFQAVAPQTEAGLYLVPKVIE